MAFFRNIPNPAPFDLHDSLLVSQSSFRCRLSSRFPVPPLAQQADFNEVGRQMAIMLQNSHFARLPFNEELSRRFLDDYLKDLDFQRLYFTQQDVDKFTPDYGDCLHTLLLQGKFMPAATEIYRVFEKRVEARVAQTAKLLDGGEFDFSQE